MATKNVRFQLRDVKSINEILLEREPGVKDGILKIGDGINKWVILPEISGGSIENTTNYNKVIIDEYKERTTANGTSIIDSSFAEISKVIGKTYKSPNLFNGTVAKDSTSIIKELPDGTFQLKPTGSGRFNPITLSPNIYSLIVKSNNDLPGVGIIASWYQNDELIISQRLNIEKNLYNISYPNTINGTYNIVLEIEVVLHAGSTNSDTADIEIMLLKGKYTSTDELPDFEKYGVTKTSYFKKFISKSADGKQESVIEFDEPIEVKSGVTIDFTKGKIIRDIEGFITEEDIDISGQYIAYNGGTETIENGVENSLPCTLEQFYIINTVEANPIDKASAKLSKLKIGDTIYSISAGSGSDLDIQINGTSIVDANGVANIPIATKDKVGLARFGTGLFVDANGNVTPTAIKTNNSFFNKTSYTDKIGSANIEYAVKAGLIPKARYTTEKYEALLTLNNDWTQDEQAAARETLGISSGTQLYKYNLFFGRTTNEYSEEIVYNITIVLPTIEQFTIVSELIEFLYHNGLEQIFTMYCVDVERGVVVEKYYNLSKFGYVYGAECSQPCTKLTNDSTTIFDLANFSGKEFEPYSPTPL